MSSPAFSSTPTPTALLVLADGTVYRGHSFGATGTVIGEVVFNTGMSGYQEVLTDPSYLGQIVTFTYPELGNVGVNPDDEESSQPQVKGAIARNLCHRPSNWRSTQSLSDYLKDHQIPGIYGLDTRALTRKLRSSGAMNGAISTEILDPVELFLRVQSAPSMEGLNLVSQVSTREIYEWTEASGAEWDFNITEQYRLDPPLTVVAIDFGVKRNILRRLVSYGCRVIVVPVDTPVATILSYHPDGIFFSNGPGDPAVVSNGIQTAQDLLRQASDGPPIFGICMGHQILGLSLGGETYKLKFGHRGLNQPCGSSTAALSSLGSPPESPPASPPRIEITSQNHGFALQPDSLGSEVEITHLNLNDRTVAGLRHRSLPLVSVQYHPEASPGPHDSDYLFEHFVSTMYHRRNS